MNDDSCICMFSRSRCPARPRTARVRSCNPLAPAISSIEYTQHRASGVVSKVLSRGKVTFYGIPTTTGVLNYVLVVLFIVQVCGVRRFPWGNLKLLQCSNVHVSNWQLQLEFKLELELESIFQIFDGRFQLIVALFSNLHSSYWKLKKSIGAKHGLEGDDLIPYEPRNIQELLRFEMPKTIQANTWEESICHTFTLGASYRGSMI